MYGYMASDIWLRTILIVRKETRCRHIGYSYRLTARVLLYAPSHRQDNTYHGLCYTSREHWLEREIFGSMGPPREGSIRRPIAPWANALPLSYVPLPASIQWFVTNCIRSKMQLCAKSVQSLCEGSSDQFFMVDPLSYFSFQPVLHDWCNKGCGMCYPVHEMMYIK